MSKVSRELQASDFIGPYRPIDVKCAPQVNAAHSRSATVTIVVAGRNYGQYVGEAIKSALCQTHPCEVLYIDDASIDDSYMEARRWLRPENIWASPYHRGVAFCRDFGLKRATGEYVIFLDADDRLPKNYVKLMLGVIGDADVAYGGAQCFGNSRYFYAAPEWGTQPLWEGNFVNTSAMYRRISVLSAGGWQDGIGTMWDWHLALRVTRAGKAVASPAILEYRKHENSFSVGYREYESGRLGEYCTRMRRSMARVAVTSILSGRLPGLFTKWIDGLVMSVRQMRLPQKPKLFLVDNSGSKEFRDLAAKEYERYRDAFDGDATFIAGLPPISRFLPERIRQDSVAKLLAGSCNELLEKIRPHADLHWMVEDDVLVPLHAGDAMHSKITEGRFPPFAVTGSYFNRHVPGRLVGGMWTGGPMEFAQRPERDVPVDICGMGCIMHWIDGSPQWGSHFGGAAAHDWSWCSRVRQKQKQITMLADVHCGHAKTETEILY